MPNQYTPGHNNQRSLVAEYLESHPMSITADISAALGINPRRVAHLLFVLREEGRAVGVKMSTGKALSWSLSATESQIGQGGPIRVMRSEWTGHGRDDWHTLFYGAAAA